MALSHAKRIDPPDWMRTDDIKRLISVLGGGDAARFVGGCVRNQLLGVPVTDMDIATVHWPQDVTKKLEEVGIKVVPTGIDYGTVTAVLDGRAFEITTLRKDVETDGRRAVVAYSTDWAEDAQRRDFTMNTLLADIDGHIYDPTGRGLADLEARRVIYVGDPAQRIAEDYLRILRFFRFHARYGAGQPDAAALKACRDAAGKIGQLSLERVTQEWFKIISVDNPVYILNIIFENNILRDFFESKYQLDLMRGVCLLQKEHDAVSVSSRLLILSGFDVNFYSKKLIISKAIQRELESISQALSLPVMDQDHAVRVAVYRAGRDAAIQGALIEAAQGKIPPSYLPKALNIARTWDIPKPPINGDDLVRQGYKPGPELGQALEKAEIEWIEGGFK